MSPRHQSQPSFNPLLLLTCFIIQHNSQKFIFFKLPTLSEKEQLLLFKRTPGFCCRGDFCWFVCFRVFPPVLSIAFFQLGLFVHGSWRHHKHFCCHPGGKTSCFSFFSCPKHRAYFYNLPQMRPLTWILADTISFWWWFFKRCPGRGGGANLGSVDFCLSSP